jgi:voltage-gated potassium channel
MWSYTSAWLSALKRPVVLFLVVFSASVILVCASLFYVLEANINPNISGFFDALYLTVTTITGVGFGDVVPVTRLGKTLAMLVMLLGTGIFVSFSAVLATTLIEIDLHLRGPKDES